MYLYDWLNHVAEESLHLIHIDLNTHTITYGETTLLRNGEQAVASIPMPDGGTVELVGLLCFDGNVHDAYKEVERLYAQYKRSVPGKHDSRRKSVFKAVTSDDLTFAELTHNLPRRQASILLEGFIVLAAASGILTWQVPTHFFWQGTDPDLILYRNWIMKEEKHDEEH